MADLWHHLGVRVAAAVTWHTQAVPFEETRAALVTLRSRVRSQAAVANWRSTGVGVACPVGGGVGAGTGDTGFTWAAAGTTVKPRPALLTVGPLGVPFAVQTHTGLGVAVAGVVVALTGSTPGAAEVEKPRVAVVTFGSVHPGFANTRP